MDLLNSVQAATAGSPAAVVGLVVQAVEGVGTLGRQLVSVKAEVSRLMNAPSGLEAVEKIKGEFEEVKVEVARLSDQFTPKEGWRLGGRSGRRPSGQGGGGGPSSRGGRLGYGSGRCHGPRPEHLRRTMRSGGEMGS